MVSLVFFLTLIYLYLGVAMAVAYRVKYGPYPSDFAIRLLLTWPCFLGRHRATSRKDNYR